MCGFYICIMFDQIKNIIKNKYIIATVVFIVFMIFGDKNNVVEQYNLRKQYNKVKTEHDYYIEQIAKAKKDYNELFSNDRNLEKFAREKYLMKRDNEDVFVIVKKNKDDKENSTVTQLDSTENE
jgi:cell division protein FtsB